MIITIDQPLSIGLSKVNGLGNGVFDISTCDASCNEGSHNPLIIDVKQRQDLKVPS